MPNVNVIRRFVRFLREVREELQRVSWPGRQDLVASTIVVFVGVTLLASYISACDLILSNAVQFLLR